MLSPMTRLPVLVGLLGLLSIGAAHAAPIEWPVADGGNGHLYEVVLNSDLGWDAAQASAAAGGGYLVTIRSGEEQDFVQSLMLDTAAPTGGFWIGLIEQGEGNWNWATGEAFQFNNWAPEQPDNANGIENRGQLLWTLGGEEPTINRRGLWNDAPEPGWAQNPFDPMLVDLNRRGWIVEYVPEPTTLLAVLMLAGASTVLRRR